MSAVAIYNADDASSTYKEVLQMAAERKRRWENLQHLNPQASCYVPPENVSNQTSVSDKYEKAGIVLQLDNSNGSNHSEASAHSAKSNIIEGSQTMFNPSAAEWTPAP